MILTGISNKHMYTAFIKRDILPTLISNSENYLKHQSLYLKHNLFCRLGQAKPQLNLHP
jgi:hypothetical protein